MEQEVIVLKLTLANCFLLKARGGYLLIDTGYDHDRQRFDNELRKNGVRMDEIKYLLLTHHHDDHSGLTNYVTSRNPEVKVIAHRLAVELLKTGANDKSRGGGYINKRVRLLASINKLIRPEWSLTFPPYFMRAKDIIIDDDSDKILRDLGVQGKIIYTPGHSIDSISIVIDDGILFAGYAAANYLNFAGTRYSPVFITDVEEYYKSWEKMIAAGAKTIYPTHGKPFPISKLKQNIWKIRNENLVKFF